MHDYKNELAEILEVVGLSDRRKYSPRELSDGQQQCIAIARALIGKPQILFANDNYTLTFVGDQPGKRTDNHHGHAFARIRKEQQLDHYSK